MKPEKKPLASLLMPIVTLFTVLMLVFCSYLFFSLPKKIDAAEEYHYSTRCDKIFEKFRTLIFDTNTMGLWAFHLVKEGIYAGGSSLDDAFYPTSVTKVSEIINFEIAKWTHEEIKRRLNRDTINFGTNMMLAPVVTNRTKWESSWSKIGPLVHLNHSAYDDYVYTIRDFSTPLPFPVWIGPSNNSSAMWSPWTYGWSYSDYSGTGDPFALFGGNFLTGAVADAVNINLMNEHKIVLATVQTPDGGFSIGNLYPIFAQSELTGKYSSSTLSPDAIGIYYFTETKDMLEAEVHDSERLELSFIGAKTIVKGKKHRRRGRNIVLKAKKVDTIFTGGIYNLQLKCSRSKEQIVSAAQLVQISCAIGMLLSIFFFILLAMEHAREQTQLQQYQALELRRTASEASRSTEQKLQHNINHEIKNKLYILHDMILESNNTNQIKIDLAINLISDILMNIRRSQLIPSLNNGTYVISTLVVNPVHFVQNYVELIQLVHGGRASVHFSASDDTMNILLDTLLYRACLMSMFYMITTIGKPACPINIQINMTQVSSETEEDNNVVKVQIIISTAIPTSRSWRLAAGSEIDAHSLHDIDLEDIREIDRNNYYESVDIVIACMKSMSIKTPSFTIHQTANEVQVVLTIKAKYVDDQINPGNELGPSLPIGKILVLDDSAFVLKMMTRKLNVAFPMHKVETFGDPYSALDFVLMNLHNDDDPLVLCLLDEQLGPGLLLGSEVARKLSTAGYTGLLISISANSTSEDFRRYESCGIQGMCGKGCTAEKLKDRILRVARRTRRDSHWYIND